jgi:hypothetical protein
MEKILQLFIFLNLIFQYSLGSLLSKPAFSSSGLKQTPQIFNNPIKYERLQNYAKCFQRYIETEAKQRFSLEHDAPFFARFETAEQSKLDIRMVMGNDTSPMRYEVSYLDDLKNLELDIVAVPKLHIEPIRNLEYFAINYDIEFLNQILRRQITKTLGSKADWVLINRLILGERDYGKYWFKNEKTKETALDWDLIEELLLRTEAGKKFWNNQEL